MLQNEKCHLLIENETQRLKMLDEQHNYMMKDWREQLKPKKKVCCLHSQFLTYNVLESILWLRYSQNTTIIVISIFLRAGLLGIFIKNTLKCARCELR